jgi:hypothetical protein
VLVDGFEAGYVWDSKSTKGTTSPNTRRPLKDGYYDHGQNCVDYIAQMIGPVAPGKKRTKREPDPYDRLFFGEDRSHAWMA